MKENDNNSTEFIEFINKELNAQFIISAAKFFETMGTERFKNIEPLPSLISLNKKIIPFLCLIKAITMYENTEIKKNEIEKDKPYNKNFQKYLLYLYYINIPIKPDWVFRAKKGWENFLDANSPDLKKSRLYAMFYEIGLLDVNLEENDHWWRDIKYYSNKMSLEKEELQKKIIGDQGEKYSELYEVKRKCTPDVVSRRNEELGYDIESQESSNDKSLRYIEVKTSKEGINRAEAHISKGQTTKAATYKNYYFHFWDISNEKRPKLAIIEGIKIADQAPKEINKGKLKEWTYPFKELKDDFFDPEILI
jgi:hypothetical protein